MSVVFSTSKHDVPFHRGIGDTYHVLAHDRHSHTKTQTKQLLRQHNDAYLNTRGVTNARLKPSAATLTLPFYFQRWLATCDSDDEDEDTHPPPNIDQDSTDSDTDYESCMLQHGYDSPVDPPYVTQPICTPLTVGKSVDPGELFGEEVIAFASKYLNLDCETSTFADRAVVAEPISSPTLSDSSSSPASTAEDVEVPWEIEPTSLSLLDTTKFEIEIDANGVETRNPWPWGDYTYRPPNPPRYFDFEEYIQAHQLAKIEEKLRVRISERFAENSIYDGMRENRGERQREKMKGKKAEKETSSPVVAFSQVVPGRTIYNP